MKIWIDLDNTPHVPLFAPIAQELERRGHEVVMTARDAFQVCELADHMGLAYRRIGRHHGKNRVRKILGLYWRSLQLLPFYLDERPDLALSHGSRSQAVLCNLLRLPTVMAADYEYVRTIPLSLPKWGILPDALTETDLGRRVKHVKYYRGLKEDVYAPLLRPDPSILQELGLSGEETIVVVRPPANEAHYHNPEGEVLLSELMSRISQTQGVRAVMLPRNVQQEHSLRASYPECFAMGKAIVPPRALDGLNLIWHSDLVVCGGGTMNREAAALGIPAYSVFRGELGALDRCLEREGRLVVIRSPEEVRSKILFVPRDKSRKPDDSPRPALVDFVGAVEAIAASEYSQPA